MKCVLFLFFYFGNMICISLKTKANYDDTLLYLVVDNEYEAADQLNKDIESIHQWSQKC